ncbi:MAG TPA: 50S ribosomal protein L29 [Solirubrobacteraceae bacterium]|nr:50S ribosomal protein L29 [Solirubrobacteraceae bacterium]
MKAKEIRDLEDGELVKQIGVLRKEVFGLRFANATGELDDTAGVGRSRRDLARALTVARERALGTKRN